MGFQGSQSLYLLPGVSCAAPGTSLSLVAPWAQVRASSSIRFGVSTPVNDFKQSQRVVCTQVRLKDPCKDRHWQLLSRMCLWCVLFPVSNNSPSVRDQVSGWCWRNMFHRCRAYWKRGSHGRWLWELHFASNPFFSGSSLSFCFWLPPPLHTSASVMLCLAPSPK